VVVRRKVKEHNKNNKIGSSHKVEKTERFWGIAPNVFFIYLYLAIKKRGEIALPPVT